MNGTNSLRRGFVFGELLVALLLLTIAVSSLAALMYTVSRRPEQVSGGRQECLVADAARGKCVPGKSSAPGSAKLLRSGCATRSVFDQRGCSDTVHMGPTETADGTTIRPRTDSAAMAVLARKQKTQQAMVRSDRGFIR
jgi:uncharacterized low-complexity protein